MLLKSRTSWIPKGVRKTLGEIVYEKGSRLIERKSKLEESILQKPLDRWPGSFLEYGVLLVEKYASTLSIKTYLKLFLNILYLTFAYVFLQAHKTVNFVSTLLQITMSDQLDLPVRQAGKCSFLLNSLKGLYYSDCLGKNL